MTFLPIVVRELRLASRKKRTFFIRVLPACLIAALTVVQLAFVGITGSSGKWVFLVTAIHILAVTLLIAPFFSADCLSQEKREGTLGLLFLTDLRSYDVLLGKFSAVAINPLLALFGALPLLAVTLTAGGVTWEQYWRTALSLLNALWVPLVIGLAASNLFKDGHRSMIFAFLANLLVCLLTTLAFSNLQAGPLLSALSPITSFLLAIDPVRRVGALTFGQAIFVSHGLGWLLMAVVTLTLKRSWQQQGAKKSKSAIRRRSRGKALLDTNPITWLIGPPRWWYGMAWVLAACAAAMPIAFAHFGDGFEGAMFFGSYAQLPLFLIMKIMIVLQACRFFSEARQSGALELVLLSPMSNREIMAGQWIALRRIFLGPAILVFSATAVLFVIGSVDAILGKSFEPFMASLATAFASGISVLDLVVGGMAAAVMGMWLSLVNAKATLAPVWAVLIAVVGPSLIPCVPSLIIHLVIFAFAYSRLQSDLRNVLQQQLVRGMAGKGSPGGQLRAPPIIRG